MGDVLAFVTSPTFIAYSVIVGIIVLGLVVVLFAALGLLMFATR